jgi:hypothetical protein
MRRIAGRTAPIYEGKDLVLGKCQHCLSSASFARLARDDRAVPNAIHGFTLLERLVDHC